MHYRPLNIVYKYCFFMRCNLVIITLNTLEMNKDVLVLILIGFNLIFMHFCYFILLIPSNQITADLQR